MIEKICCFAGHQTIRREDVKDLMINLDKVVKVLIEQGVKQFLCGGTVGFNMTSALYISTLKEQGYPIKLFLVLPYNNQAQKESETQKEIYEFVKSVADKITFMPKDYETNYVKKCNQRIVECSHLCISYLRSNKGHTAQTVRYAKKKGIKVISL